MADKSKIEWTEATWNPITGCSVTSPGCTNCYAMRLAGTRLKHHPSRKGLTQEVNGNHVWTGEVRFNEQWLDQPLRWTRPRMIFVCAHGDLFHESVTYAQIDRIVGVMRQARQHTFQVLTKRSARMLEYFTALPYRIRDMDCDAALDELELPLPNVWLGVSAEDQKRADERIPDLLETPAAVRWVSAEPLLGSINFCTLRAGQMAELNAVLGFDFDQGSACNSLDWVVAGGESGPGAREMNPEWARWIREQCERFGTAFYMKQMARKAPIPDDLMIREYPQKQETNNGTTQHTA